MVKYKKIKHIYLYLIGNTKNIIHFLNHTMDSGYMRTRSTTKKHIARTRPLGYRDATTCRFFSPQNTTGCCCWNRAAPVAAYSIHLYGASWCGTRGACVFALHRQSSAQVSLTIPCIIWQTRRTQWTIIIIVVIIIRQTCTVLRCRDNDFDHYVHEWRRHGKRWRACAYDARNRDPCVYFLRVFWIYIIVIALLLAVVFCIVYRTVTVKMFIQNIIIEASET